MVLIVIANLTSWTQFKDQTCQLIPGDHPYVAKRSCMNYRDAKILTLQDLQSLQKAALIEMNAPMAAAMLAKIRHGAGASIRGNDDAAEVLLDQGLI